MQLSEYLLAELDLTVVKNQEPYMILGQDLFGGPRSKFHILNWNTEHSFVTLYDPLKHEVANVFYLKNVEVVSIPFLHSKAAVAQLPSAASASSSVSPLFRG